MSPKLILIGWDSADWDMAGPLMDAGEMPALRSIVEGGASGKLRTLEPPLSPMLWTSIATGKRANQHGILGFTEVDRLTGRVRPVVAASRQCAAIWDILAAQGLRCHTIGWFATHGGQIPAGSVVSNFFPAPTAGPDQEWPPSPKGSIWPEEIASVLDDLRVSPSDLGGDVIGVFCPRWKEVDTKDDPRLNHLQIHLAEAFTIQAATCWILENQPWDFVAVYFRAMDEIAHHFMSFHPPRMGGVTPRDFELYREVMRSTYRLHDLMLSRLMALAPADTHFMVVSDHGFQSGAHRPRFTPRAPAGITVWHREHGLFAASGPRFSCDALVHGAGLLDITPTILALFGLPAGGDMPGRVLHSVFKELPETSPAFVETWETGVKPGVQSLGFLSEEENAALIEQFVALGYMERPTGDLSLDAAVTDRENRWTLARSLIASGRPAEALPVLAALYREMPERTDFAQTFAQCQADCGLLEDAEETLEAILETACNAPVAALLRARMALAKGDGAAALLHLESARATPVGQEPRFWRQLGLCYLQLRRWEDALAAAEQLARLVPDDALAPLGRSLCLRRLGRPSEAKSAALAALALDFHLPRAHIALAGACLKLGERERALEAALQAVELAPAFRDALQMLALAYRVCGEAPASLEVTARLRFFSAAARDSRAKLRAQMHDAFTARIPPPKSAVSRARLVPEEEIVIVTGLPRSGTSLVMQMLHAGGYPILSDGIRQADEHNPEGYWEWEKIRRLPREPHLIDQAAGRAVKVVTPLLPHLPAGRRYRFIILLRPSEEIARSQAAMRTKRTGQDVEPNLLVPLLEKHKEQDRAFLSQAGFPVLEIDFHHILANPDDAVARFAGFLGIDRLPDSGKMRDQVHPELRHHHSEIEK